MTSAVTTDEKWHAIALSKDLPAFKSVGVECNGQALVLYRAADGTPVALEDRCPHRWAPLSGGRIEGDNIVCPYHGFKFCPKGLLVQETGRDVCGLNPAKTFSIVESDNRIWVWLGSDQPKSFSIVSSRIDG